MKRNLYLLSLMLLILLNLSACGFHLRGIGNIPKPLRKIYITGDQRYSNFMQSLKTELINGGINIPDNADEAPYTLVVSHAHTSTHQKTTASSQQLRQYQIKFSAHFALTGPAQKPIVKPFTLSASQTQTMAAGNLLHNTPQLKQTKHDLYRQVINQLFDHLSSTNVKDAIQQRDQTTQS